MLKEEDHSLKFSQLLTRIRERFGLAEKEPGIEILRRTIMVYAVIFVLWGLYRLLFRFPAFIEEFFLKPLVFLPPVFSVLGSEGKQGKALWKALGFSRLGLSAALYFGLTLGVVYMLAVRLGGFVSAGRQVVSGLSVSGFDFVNIFSLSLLTAFWEQIVFSGFVLLRLRRVFGSEWSSVSLTAILYTLLHLPVLWLESEFGFHFILIELILFFFVGFGNSVLMLRTRNIIAPILSHTFWAMALSLFV